MKDPYSVIEFPAMEILTHAQDVEAEALADWLIHQLVRQAVKPHMSSQGNSSATFTLIGRGKNENVAKSNLQSILHPNVPCWEVTPTQAKCHVFPQLLPASKLRNHGFLVMGTQ
jgi:hypothetical protein